MVKIKVDKEKLQVIFQCKNIAEMKHTLDIYIKGNEKIVEEAKKSIGILEKS